MHSGTWKPWTLQLSAAFTFLVAGSVLGQTLCAASDTKPCNSRKITSAACDKICRDTGKLTEADIEQILDFPGESLTPGPGSMPGTYLKQWRDDKLAVTMVFDHERKSRQMYTAYVRKLSTAEKIRAWFGFSE
jgi:hypothetical protein